MVGKCNPRACATGIHGCKSALIRPFGRSISSNMTRYSPQSIDRRNGDSEFSLSRIPVAQAPSAPRALALERDERKPYTGIGNESKAAVPAHRASR